MASILDVPAHLQLANWVTVYEGLNGYSPVGPKLISWAALCAENGWANSTLIHRVHQFHWPKPTLDPTWRWVYVARRDSDSAVKVGVSGSPVRRISELGRGVRIVGCWPHCSERHEAAVQLLVSSYGTIGRTHEWFPDSPPLRAFCWLIASWRDDRRASVRTCQATEAA